MHLSTADFILLYVTRRAHRSRASPSRLYFVVIGCSETRTVSARLVLNTHIPARLFTSFSSLQFSSCAVNKPFRLAVYYTENRYITECDLITWMLFKDVY